MKKLLSMFLLSFVLILAACGGADKEYKQQLKDAEKSLEESKRYSEELEEVSKQIDETSESIKELQKEMGIENQMSNDEAEKLIEYEVLSDDDVLKSIMIENGEVRAVIEILNDMFEDKSILAETMYSRAGDAFLEYGGWEVLTIEFVGIGTVSMDRSEKETNEYGMDYFPLEKIIYQLN